MRKISAYAHCNPLQAQILIFVSQTLLVFSAIKIGSTLDSLNIRLPISTLIGGVAAYLILAVVVSGHKKNYWKRSVLYFLSGLSLFVSLCSFFNDNNNVKLNLYEHAGGLVIAPTTKTISKKEQRKELRVLFKEVRKEAHASGNKAGKLILTLLVVLGAIGLCAIITALSCSIMCNGSGALGGLVLVVGVTGVLLLMSYILNKINKKKVTSHSTEDK